MYDNSSNHNISHQNRSVEKGSYDASISQPETPQSADPGMTFRIHTPTRDEYGDTLGSVAPTPSGSSGGRGTHPPGRFGTPAPDVTATVAPPGERVTPRPTKTKPAVEGAAAGVAKKGVPGFTAAFAIAGMLDSRLRDDAAQRVGGSTGDGERRGRSFTVFFFSTTTWQIPSTCA